MAVGDGTLIIDFVPWAEDRAELKQVKVELAVAKQDALDTTTQIKAVAARLQRDARLIREACASLDRMSRELKAL